MAEQAEVGASEVFAYDSTGSVIDTFTITGRPENHALGIAGLALDASTGRVLRNDLAKGPSRSSPLIDLLACGLVVIAPSGCEPGVEDNGLLPRGAAFDQAGNLYVTDVTQGLLDPSRRRQARGLADEQHLRRRQRPGRHT